MTTPMPIETSSGSMKNLWTERPKLKSDDEHQALREKIRRDTEEFLASGGKIDKVGKTEMVDYVSQQCIQSREANRRRAVSNKPLSSREAQIFRIACDIAKGDWVESKSIVEAVAKMGVDRGNAHAYFQKIADKGFWSRGEKKGFYRILMPLSNSGTIKAKRGA